MFCNLAKIHGLNNMPSSSSMTVTKREGDRHGRIAGSYTELQGWGQNIG